MPPRNQSPYVCIIAKTPLEAKTAFSLVFAWLCARLRGIDPQVQVFLQTSNDYNDGDLENDIILIFKTGRAGGFAHDEVAKCLDRKPAGVASVQVSCISEEYAQHVRAASFE